MNRLYLLLILVAALPVALRGAEVDKPWEEAAGNLNRHRCATAQVTAVAPSIDGVLDAACWQQAVFVSGLKDNRQWRLARPVTALALAWDAGALYVAVLADEPDEQAGRTRHTTDGSPLWEDDCIEVFLSPDNGRHYWQFLVNLAGARWLAAGELADGPRSVFAQRDPGALEVAVRRVSTGWVVEIAVPWSLLETAAPALGSEWGFNWRRYRYVGDSGLIHGWCVLPNVPARPDLFGRLRFAGESP